MREIRILVGGSRLWNDAECLARALDRAAAGRYPVTVVHGMCDPRNAKGQIVAWQHAYLNPGLGPFLGADWMADRHAETRGWRTERVPADWKLYANAAGPIRNQLMVARGANVLIAAPHPAEPSPGTRDCIRRAKAAGIRIVDLTAVPQPDGLW